MGLIRVNMDRVHLIIVNLCLNILFLLVLDPPHKHLRLEVDKGSRKPNNFDVVEQVSSFFNTEGQILQGNQRDQLIVKLPTFCDSLDYFSMFFVGNGFSINNGVPLCCER